MALTELYLKKKKRGVLAYTPVGAVAKLGTDALKETLSKIDIIEMTFEAELAGQHVQATSLLRSSSQAADARRKVRRNSGWT